MSRTYTYGEVERLLGTDGRWRAVGDAALRERLFRQHADALAARRRDAFRDLLLHTLGDVPLGTAYRDVEPLLAKDKRSVLWGGRGGGCRWVGATGLSDPQMNSGSEIRSFSPLHSVTLSSRVLSALAFLFVPFYSGIDCDHGGICSSRSPLG